MAKHLERDLEGLQREILELAAVVEEAIQNSVGALRRRDANLACRVAGGDSAIDHREVHIEEECLKMLALHQPVAIDLRRITAVLKINNDLERMADLAVNIAERAMALAAQPRLPVPDQFEPMTELALTMVHDSIDAFISLNPRAARRICNLDDEVDRYNREIIDELCQLMQDHSELVEPALQMFGVTRHMEQIADHATNIAEDVVYLVEGEIIRHRSEHQAGVDHGPISGWSPPPRSSG